MSSERDGPFFDTMGNEFEARLKRNTITTRTSRSDGRELTVSNPLAVLEAKFSYKVLDRLYSPSFVAIERDVDGTTRHIVFEIVGVSPTHYQLSGVDSSMPTLLRKEYLDTIKESWGKSQETWIDLAAVPTNYLATTSSGKLEFARTLYAPLPGAQAFLLSKDSVEQFLCVAGGERIGRMAGFDLPFTVDMDSLIRFHCAFFGFSLDYAEPLVYREAGKVRIGKIGEVVDRFFEGKTEGRRYTSSIEVVSFDPESLAVRWSPLQYVLRHKHEGNLLKFSLRTGRSVAVTPGHSVFALRDGRVQCLASSSLRVGDFIVGSRSIPSNTSTASRINLLEICDRSGAKGINLVGVDRSAFRPLKADAPAWKKCLWKRRGSLPIEFWGLLSEEVRSRLELGYKNCLHPISTSLKLDEDLARLFGYYVAEGRAIPRPRGSYAVQFTLNRTDDREMIKDIREIVRGKFGIPVTMSKHGEKSVRVTFRSKILAYAFAFVAGTGAQNKRVPSFVLNSPQTIRRAFLKAWAEGGHGVAASKALMNDISYLLLMDGITSAVRLSNGGGTSRVGDGVVSVNPRYTLQFPDAPKLRRARTSGRAGPTTHPVVALPDARSFLAHPDGARSKPRLSGKLSQASDSRPRELNSPIGPPPDGGAYRTAVGSHLLRDGSGAAATQLLVDANEELAAAKRMSESDLAFYEIESIDRVPSTSPFVYDVSVPGDENFLAGFGGVFCHNTGSGKSNLASSLLRLAMSHDPDLAVVVVDIAGEYGVNLLDLLGEDARLVSTELFDAEDEFAASQAVPESLEETLGRKAIEDELSRLYAKGIEKLSLQEGGGLDLGWIQQLLENAVESGKPGGTAAKMALGRLTTEFFEKRRLKAGTRLSDLDQQAASGLAALLTDVHTNVHQMSALVKDIDLIVKQLETGDFGVSETAKLSPEKLAEQLARGNAPRLNVIYAPEPLDARQTVQRLINRLLFMKKKFGNKQRVLVVLDEAQEYIPDEHTPKDWTTQSNRAVEQLLRQGRKYRLHCWMATQRVARLNVNALQQLHSYFVSTLPRMYDRMVIADAFALPYEVLERSAGLGTGEWLFVSFKAAKRRNVPVFLKTENNETVVAERLT